MIFPYHIQIVTSSFSSDMAIVGKTRESMGEIEKDGLKPLNDLLQNFVIWSQKCENFPSPSGLGLVLDFWGQAGGPGHFCQRAMGAGNVRYQSGLHGFGCNPCDLARRASG